jgi:hypothetical protein
VDALIAELERIEIEGDGGRHRATVAAHRDSGMVLLTVTRARSRDP